MASELEKQDSLKDKRSSMKNYFTPLMKSTIQNKASCENVENATVTMKVVNGNACLNTANSAPSASLKGTCIDNNNASENTSFRELSDVQKTMLKRVCDDAEIDKDAAVEISYEDFLTQRRVTKLNIAKENEHVNSVPIACKKRKLSVNSSSNVEHADELSYKTCAAENTSVEDNMLESEGGDTKTRLTEIISPSKIGKNSTKKMQQSILDFRRRDSGIVLHAKLMEKETAIDIADSSLFIETLSSDYPHLQKNDQNKSPDKKNVRQKSARSPRKSCKNDSPIKLKKGGGVNAVKSPDMVQQQTEETPLSADDEIIVSSNSSEKSSSTENKSSSKLLVMRERILLQKKATEVLRRARKVEESFKIKSDGSQKVKVGLIQQLKSSLLSSGCGNASTSSSSSDGIRRSSRIHNKVLLTTDTAAFSEKGELVTKPVAKQQPVKEEELAPLFRKKTATKQSKVPELTAEDVERMERRRVFLLSGVPEELKKLQANAVPVVPISEYGLVPVISHVQQQPFDPAESEQSLDNYYWHLPSPVHARLHLRPEPDFAAAKETITKDFLPSTNLPIEAAVAKCLDLKPMQTLVKTRLDDLLQEIQSFNPQFPVRQTYEIIAKKKQEDANAFCEETGASNISDSTAMLCRDLWTVVYSPDNGSEVMGNNGVVKSMHQWLVDWKCVLLGAPVTTSKSNVSVPKYRAACLDKQTNESDDDFLPVKRQNNSASKKFVVSSDSEDEGPRLCNTSLLIGPTGCGKTALVYALARELNYKVFEINGTCGRSAKQISTQLAETTQSHHVEQKIIDTNQDDTKSPAVGFEQQQQGASLINVSPTTQKPKSVLSAFATLMGKKQTQVNGDLATSKKTSLSVNKGTERRLQTPERSPKKQKSSKPVSKYLSKRKAAPSSDSEDDEEYESCNKRGNRQRLSLRKSTRKIVNIEDTDEYGNSSDDSACEGGKKKLTRSARKQAHKKKVKDEDTTEVPDVQQLTSDDTSTATVAVANAALNLSSLSVILFDEVDTLLEEDKGFWGAVQSFMASTKVPIILTASDPFFATKFGGQCEYDEFTLTRPPAATITSYLQVMCLAEGFRTHFKDVEKLVLRCGCDLRYALTSLQTIIASESYELSERPVVRAEEANVPEKDLKKTGIMQDKAKGNKRSRVVVSSDESSRDCAAVSDHSTTKLSAEVDCVQPCVLCDCTIDRLSSGKVSSLIQDESLFSLLPFKQLAAPAPQVEQTLASRLTGDKKKRRILDNCDLYDSETDEVLTLPEPTLAPATSGGKDIVTNTIIVPVDIEQVAGSDGANIAESDPCLQSHEAASVQPSNSHELLSASEKIIGQGIMALWQMLDNMSVLDLLGDMTEDNGSCRGHLEELVVTKAQATSARVLNSMAALHDDNENVALQMSFPTFNRSQSHETSFQQCQLAAKDVAKNTPVNALNMHRVICVDHLPVLRAMTAAEEFKRKAVKKRRFLHYLDPFFNRTLKKSTLATLQTTSLS